MKTFWQGSLIIHPRHQNRREQATGKLYRDSLNQQRRTL